MTGVARTNHAVHHRPAGDVDGLVIVQLDHAGHVDLAALEVPHSHRPGSGCVGFERIRKKKQRPLDVMIDLDTEIARPRKPKAYHVVLQRPFDIPAPRADVHRFDIMLWGHDHFDRSFERKACNRADRRIMDKNILAIHLDPIALCGTLPFRHRIDLHRRVHKREARQGHYRGDNDQADWTPTKCRTHMDCPPFIFCSPFLRKPLT